MILIKFIMHFHISSDLYMTFLRVQLVADIDFVCIFCVLQSRFAPHAFGPSPSCVGKPGSGNPIKPFTARQFYITEGSVAVGAKGCNMLGDTG